MESFSSESSFEQLWETNKTHIFKWEIILSFSHSHTQRPRSVSGRFQRDAAEEQGHFVQDD